MVLKFIPNIKKLEKGITLIELIVVIFIIAIFSAILISNFPKIQREYALSRATYKLAQNLRRVQDLGLSGVKITDNTGQLVKVGGYGLYINLDTPQQYIIYGNSCPVGNPDYQYTLSDPSCVSGDYIIDTVNVNEDKVGVYIEAVNNIDQQWTSINFSPPNPYLSIENISSGQTDIEIVLAVSSDSSIPSRTVSINTSGLIEVK